MVDIPFSFLPSDDQELIKRKNHSKQILLLLSFSLILASLALFFLSINEQHIFVSLETNDKELEQLLALANEYNYKDFSTWEVGRQWYLDAVEVGKRFEKFSSSEEHVLKPLFTLYEKLSYWCGRNNRYQEGIDMAYKALEIAAQLTAPPFKDGRLFTDIVYYLYKLNRYPEGLAACEQAATNVLFSNNSIHLAFLLTKKGHILYEQDNFQKALDCYQQADEIQLQKQSFISTDAAGSRMYILSRLCGVLSELGHFEEALQIADKASALGAIMLKPDHPKMGMPIEYKAKTLFKQKKYEEALELYKKAQQLYLGLPEEEPYAWNGIGWCLFHLEKYREGLDVFTKNLSLSLGYHLKTDRSVLEAYRGMGWCYIMQNRASEGLPHLINQLNISATVYAHTPRMAHILNDFETALQEGKKQGVDIQAAASKAYKISQELLGSDHSLTLRFLEESSSAISRSDSKACRKAA